MVRKSMRNGSHRHPEKLSTHDTPKQRTCVPKGPPRTKNIPILVFSSMTNDQSRIAVRELGADGFVGKRSVEQMLKQLVATARIPLASSLS